MNENDAEELPPELSLVRDAAVASAYPQMPFHEELSEHFQMSLFKEFHALSHLCFSDEMFDSFEDNELIERNLIDEIDYY